MTSVTFKHEIPSPSSATATDLTVPTFAQETHKGELPGLLFGETNGHLLVIRGFDRNGNVITNDPAAPTDEDTHKTYGRADFERVWLGGSGGIVYVMYPRGKPLPPNVPDLPANW